MFTPVDYGRIEQALGSTRGWVELAVVGACAAIAWWIDRRQEQAALLRAPAPGPLPVPFAGFAHVLFPVLAVVLLLVARSLFRRYSPPLFIDVALPLATAFAAIRMLVYALRRLFPAQRWLPAWERGIAITVLLGLALHYAGVMPEILAELDSATLPLGPGSPSILTLGKAVVLIVLTLVLTLWLSGMVERRLMGSEALESSVRVVLAKFVRALLLLIAVLLALQAVGIDLTVLSVFGGAVGVGIGLGLQKLASNYIAGFAVLIDRSVRLGDLVTVEGRTGQVVGFTSRYVVLRNFDGVEAIVPNETLVTTTVLNHSRGKRESRVTLVLTITYDSDLDRAIETAETAAAGVPRVLATPAPRAYVSRFLENGIELELTFWIGDPEEGHQDVRSAVARASLAELRKAGVKLPHRDAPAAAVAAAAAAVAMMNPPRGPQG